MSFVFFKNNADLNDKRFEFKSDLIKYLEEKAESGDSVKLTEIEEIARKYMPAEEIGQIDELADEFVSYLNSEECSVPTEFIANRDFIIKNIVIIL